VSTRHTVTRSQSVLSLLVHLLTGRCTSNFARSSFGAILDMANSPFDSAAIHLPETRGCTNKCISANILCTRCCISTRATPIATGATQVGAGDRTIPTTHSIGMRTFDTILDQNYLLHCHPLSN
jgi:hypothetical protein